MDGHKAAMNVLGGVVVGGSVPIISALVLTQALPEFHWLDHFFTILLLSIACAAVGVLINLPWSFGGATTRKLANGEPIASPDDFIFDAGEPGDRGAAAHDPGAHGAHQRRCADPPHAPPKRYAMSRREALRALDLEHDADDEAVRDAFRRLAKEHHPDHAAAAGTEAVEEATRKFVRLREAYEVLIDEE